MIGLDPIAAVVIPVYRWEMNENPFLTDRALATSPPHQPQSRPRILVVEDNIEIRHLNVEALMDSGYHVDVAEDGAAGWDALQLNHYDLMITENAMPKVSGLELLQKLHAARIILPVIMATGTLPQEEFARSLWLRPAATLLQPYTLAEFLRTVKEVLHGTAGAGEVIAPLPAKQREPSAVGLHL